MDKSTQRGATLTESSSPYSSSGQYQAVVGLKGLESALGGIPVKVDRLLYVDIPDQLDVDFIRRLQQDLEVIVAKLRDNPDEMVELFASIAGHNIQDAHELASSQELALLPAAGQETAEEGAAITEGAGGMGLLITAALYGALLYSSNR